MAGGHGLQPSHFRGDDRPVEMVSWDDGQDFCQRLRQLTGKPIRLPTEAEWEYACRAGTTSEYYTGGGEDDLKKAGWYAATSSQQTQPVGKLKPNAWGLFDMHGNVWEWCADWISDKYDPQDQKDTRGPNSGNARVLRGGSWDNGPDSCRAACRNWRVPSTRDRYFGLRVCFCLD